MQSKGKPHVAEPSSAVPGVHSHLPSARASVMERMTISRAIGRNVKDVPMTEMRPVPR